MQGQYFPKQDLQFEESSPRPVAVATPLTIAASSTPSADTTATTSHTANLPSGIAAGNLLLVFFAIDVNETPATPSGWSLIGSQAAGGGTGITEDKISVFAKIASGSEGSTLAFTTVNSKRSAHTAYRITNNRNGVTTSEIQLSSANDGGTTSSSPNSPNLAPGWGAVEILWFSAMVNTNGGFGMGSYPSGYTLGQLTINSTSSTRIASAAKLASASSEDPGAYGIGGSDYWAAVTVGIRPL